MNDDGNPTNAEQLVVAFDQCRTSKELDFLAKVWRRLNKTFTEQENDAVLAAAKRAAATGLEDDDDV